MKKTSLKEMLNESTGTEFLKTKEEIEAWLKEYEVEDYEIHDDLTVTVDYLLDLSFRHLGSIPVKFRKTKSINVSSNYLTSLDWAPEVVDGDFVCRGNKLTSLEGGPEVVKGSYLCSYNYLGNLKGIADEVGSNLQANGCDLASLEFLPNKIGGNLHIHDNKITSFRGIYKVLKQINTRNHRFGGTIAFERNPIEKGLISLMGIKGIRELGASADENVELKKAIDIINNSLENKVDAITTQKLLADAGLMKYS